MTGAIGSGKSAVCSLFQELGAYTVNADEIVYTLLAPHTDLGNKIIALLGEEVVVDGQFDRRKIADCVFRDQTLLKHLEEILHPEVQRLIEKKIQEVEPYFPLFVAEVPLLFETQMEQQFDCVIFVTADPQKCRERFQKKLNYDFEEYTRRMKRLIPEEKKIKKSQFIIKNNSSFASLREQVTSIFNQLTPSITS